MKDRELRSCVRKSNQGRLNWKGKRGALKAFYSNRRRIKDERGKRLLGY